MLSRKGWSLNLVLLKFEDVEQEKRSCVTFSCLLFNAKSRTILDMDTGKGGRREQGDQK